MEDKAPTARRASKRVPRRPGRYDDHDPSIDRQRQPKRRKKGKERDVPTEELSTPRNPVLACLLETGKAKVDDRLMRAVERDFRLLDGEVRPPVPHCDGQVRPPRPYNLRSGRRCPVNTGQDTRVRILDGSSGGPLPLSQDGHEETQALPYSDGNHVPPTEDELDVAQALSNWNTLAHSALEDHKMLRADSELQSQLKEAGDPTFACGFNLDSNTSTDFKTAVCGEKSPSAAELQHQLVEETPVPLTPAVPAPRRAVASCRSRRGKIRARSLSQPQRNPATRTFPPVARRRADYHTAQEEAGHLSHAPVSDIVSDASDDLEVDGAMLSEEAALRDGEDFIMSDRGCLVITTIRTPNFSGGSKARGACALPQDIAQAEPSRHWQYLSDHNRLENCLRCWSRRWAAYEFFYSAMDRPFFMHNEFLSYLRNIGIPPSTKLTRTEWSVLRAFSGHPRRLSWAFLEQERIKLEKFRRKVRLAYATQGAKIPSNMPRPLKVGQRVVARHPQNRQLLDGKILTASSDSYRVQFDSWEQGVQVVKDVDIMPADPSENLPPSLLATQPPALVNGRLATTAAVRAQRLGVLDNLRPLAPAQGAPDALPMSVVSQPSVDGKGQVGEGYQLMLPVENPLPTWQDIRLEATRILRTAQMDGNHEQKDQAGLREKRPLSMAPTSARGQAQHPEEANAKHLLLTGCTAMWVILQKAAAAPMPPQVLISLLQEAYVLMKPKYATNQQTFLKIQQTVSDILKPHLEGNEICRCDPNL